MKNTTHAISEYKTVYLEPIYDPKKVHEGIVEIIRLVRELDSCILSDT